MRTRSILLSLLLATSLACGQKPNKGKDKKDPLLLKNPVNNTQPVASNKTPDTKPVPPTTAVASTSTSAPATLLDSPDISAYLAEYLAKYLLKGKELEAQSKVFAYTFEKGKNAAYQLSIQWKLNGVKGAALPTNNFSGTFNTDLKWAIQDVSATGEATIDLTYGKIAVKFESIPLQLLSGVLLAPFAKMEGKTFSIKISKEGKILELTGQDKILEDALVGFEFIALKEQIVGALGDKALKQVLGQGFLAFPANELKKGDNFKIDGSLLPVPGIGQITVEETVTLEGLREIDGKQFGVFSLDIFAGPDQSAPSVAKLPGFELSIKSYPSTKGFFAFDVGRGLPDEMAVQVDLEVEVVALKEDGTKDTPKDGLAEVTVYVKLVE